MKFRPYVSTRSVVATLALLMGLVVLNGGKAFAYESFAVSDTAALSSQTSQSQESTSGGGGRELTATSVRGSTSSHELAVIGARETFYMAIGLWMLVAGAVLSMATNRNTASAEVKPSEARA